MATAALPGNLHAKLTSLARRMATLRLARTAAGFVLLLAVTAGLALLADHWLKLPGVVRFLLLGGWGALAVFGVVRCIRSLGIQADVDALAALIENEYPNLAERLSTSVELMEAADKAHGSPALIDLLLKETEIRASKLDFLQAAPERPTYRRALIAAIAVALLLAPAFVWPHSYRIELARLAMPWTKPALNYEVVANPAGAAVARASALTLSAVIKATEGYDEIPNSATLVVTDSTGKSDRFAMKCEQPLVYSCRLSRVLQDFHYHIEAGEAATAEFQVTAVDPVQLVADSPKITVTPPAYARKNVETKTVIGLTDFSALQFGDMVFEFRFSRPAISAKLNWMPDRREETPKEPFELALSADRQSGRFEMPVRGSGRLALVLEAEHGITTELPPLSINVITDRAPAFVKVGGISDQLRTVSMAETVPLDITATDDLEVATADVEYRVNEGPIQVERIALDGLGTPQAAGKHLLKLAGKVKEGDTFQYRLRITDNRNVPEEKLKPNVAYMPDNKPWMTFKIARNAEPLKKQEILAQRDDIRKRLEALINDLKLEQRAVIKHQMELKQQIELRRNPPLTPADEEELRDLRRAHLDHVRTLRDLARDASAAQGLQSLANRLQDVADQEMQNTTTALQATEKAKSNASVRAQELTNAADQIDSAINRLEGLKKTNDQIAQQRLDQMKLDELAEKQRQLAEKTAEETDPKKAKELAREQKQIAEELKRLTEQSQPLRQSVEEAQAEKNRELAEKARELADQQRELAKSMEESSREAMKGLLGDLAKKQRELADEAAKLAQDTKNSSKAAQATPLDAEKPKEAADSLEKGDANNALTKQEQTIQDLEHLANEFDKAIKLARDPKEAALQLMRIQDDLKNRTTNEGLKTPLAKMPAEQLDKLHKDQQAIKSAAEQLSTPETNKEAKQSKLEALDHAQAAADALKKKNQSAAESEMTKARQALQRLAKALPSLDQRLEAARDEVGQLRRKQEELSRQAESIARESEQSKSNSEQARRNLTENLSDSARKQAQIADRVEKLDIPTLEERQDRTADTLKKALQDLQSARAQDIPASQADARRQLERLEQALNKQQPADDKAAELARQQKQIADQADKIARQSPESANTADAMKKLQGQQQRLSQDLARLPQMEAVQRQSEAVEATNQAEKAAGQNPADLARKANDAAQALQRLADQLSGKENDSQKAERLAKRQAELANDAAKSPSDELRKKQKEVQEEARQIRGGDEAAKEKKQADESLSRLAQSSSMKSPEAHRKAIDALHDLADRLAGGTDADKAARLAREQRELAKEAARSQPTNPEAARQQAQQAAQKQGELARQMQRLNPGQNRDLASEAAQQMRSAQKSLEQSQNQKQAQDSLEKAAQSAEKLSQEMTRQQGEHPSNPIAPDAPRSIRSQHANSQGQQSQIMPGPAQSDQARQLAQRQRELRDAVAKAMESAQNQQPTENPAAGLAKEQKEIAKDAQQLAQQQAQQNGRQSPQSQQSQQAAQAAQQASNQLQNGALPQALESGKQASQQMRQLAEGNKTGASDQSRKLAQRQEEVNRQLQQMANNSQAQKAQQQAAQRSLQEQAQQLGQQMQQQAGQMRPSQSQQAMQQAANAAHQAQGAMQQAQRGNPSTTRQSQQQAAQNLDRASQLAQQAAQQANNGQPQQGSQAGKSLQQAQNQMGNAQRQLGQGQNQRAQGSMQKAAQALQQAAQQMGQNNQDNKQPPTSPTNPNGNDGRGHSAIDLSKYGDDAKKYQGKAWGELPGELRTRIIQDLKAQYGDDYGRMIKFYFEQLADRKSTDPR